MELCAADLKHTAPSCLECNQVAANTDMDCEHRHKDLEAGIEEAIKMSEATDTGSGAHDFNALRESIKDEFYKHFQGRTYQVCF